MCDIMSTSLPFSRRHFFSFFLFVAAPIFGTVFAPSKTTEREGHEASESHVKIPQMRQRPSLTVPTSISRGFPLAPSTRMPMRRASTVLVGRYTIHPGAIFLSNRRTACEYTHTQKKGGALGH